MSVEIQNQQIIEISVDKDNLNQTHIPERKDSCCKKGKCSKNQAEPEQIEVKKDEKSCCDKLGKCSNKKDEGQEVKAKKDSCCKSKGGCSKNDIKDEENLDLQVEKIIIKPQDIEVNYHVDLANEFKKIGSCCKTDQQVCCKGEKEYCTECTDACEPKEEEEEACKKACCADKKEGDKTDKKEPKKVYTKAELKKWGIIALILAFFTIFYNVGEGVVAIYYGWEEESISLLGFGSDSFTEVFSAIIVFIQLVFKEKVADGEGNQAKNAKSVNSERISTIIIGSLLTILGIGAMVGSVFRLIVQEYPDTAVPNLIIAAASLSFMFFLWYLKLKASIILDSKTIAADANCSLGCIYLSVSMAIGSVIQIITTEYFNSTFFWWMDSAVGIIIGLAIIKDGVECIKNACSKNFDGTCGCCK